jgi:hypothetical protein
LNFFQKRSELDLNVILRCKVWFLDIVK